MHASLQEILAVRHAAKAGRFNIYGLIHKGIRLMLVDTLAQAGRVDAADSQSVHRLLQAVESLAAMCSSHLDHENEFVHPALERAEAGTSQRIAAEHVEHERDIALLRSHARGLAECAPEERHHAAHALYQALALFTAHNLMHMHIEETAHNAVLWAHYSDAEILDIQNRLVAHLEPNQKMADMRWMLPAIAPAERLQMLTGLRENAPAPAFEAVLALAQQHLDLDAWGQLARGLQRPPVAGLVN